jgi:putative transposase
MAPLHIASAVHLPLTPRHAMARPRMIMSLGRRYVQYTNTTYRRFGTAGR